MPKVVKEFPLFGFRTYPDQTLHNVQYKQCCYSNLFAWSFIFIWKRHIMNQTKWIIIINYQLHMNNGHSLTLFSLIIPKVQMYVTCFNPPLTPVLSTSSLFFRVFIIRWICFCRPLSTNTSLVVLKFSSTLVLIFVNIVMSSVTGGHFRK